MLEFLTVSNCDKYRQAGLSPGMCATPDKRFEDFFKPRKLPHVNVELVEP